MILNNSLDQLMAAILIVVLGWALARVLSFFISRYAARWAKKTSTKIDDFSINVFHHLVTFVIFIVAFWYATQALTLTEGIDDFIGKAVGILLAIKITASVLKVMDFVVDEYLVPYASKNNILDKTIVPTLDRIVKLVVWLVVFLMIISNLGYDITSLLAGLGIGGLAVALAAQEALSNFFGSISIFADKTFKVGDYIQTKDFKGTIKGVGLRSTRIDTVDGTELIVPNSQLANTVIENLSRRPKRRVDLQIGLVYETSNAKMKLAMKTLRDLIKGYKGVENHCRVHFSEFGDSGLHITLTYWIKEVDLEAGQKIQNEINLKIKQEFEKAKIDFAYPTQLLYLHNADALTKKK